MRIKFLGTAAYEGVPSMFCSCRVCRESVAAGGRNLRSRSQTLIDGELLIDFPPDTVWHSQRFGLDWGRIGDCLITHSHSDHLYPEDVEMAGEGYSLPHPPLRFFSARDGFESLRRFTEKPLMKGAATCTLIEPGKLFRTGGDSPFEVLPLWANHDPASDPVIYSVARGNKRLLYALDSGVFPEKTWAGLKGGRRFDLVVLDCTGCMGETLDWRDGHMSLKTNLEMLSRLRSEGLADDDTVIVATHFSHNGGQTYDEMLAAEREYGILIAYDGMEIEI